MNLLTDTLRKVYIFIFARKALYSFNLLLYKLSMRGLGIMNHENDIISGEDAFVKFMISSGRFRSGSILDVGANIGGYSVMLRNRNVVLPIYAFEPHPVAYNKLEEAALVYHFKPIKKGAGERALTTFIYDYVENKGSEHASMYREVIADFRKSEVEEIPIDLTTIDDFIAEHRLREIALLKVDTEGNELNVLKGARQAIEEGLVNVIQVEFNEMNVISRTFFKDFIDLLPGYDFYRMLPDGLMPLGEYNVAAFEIFAFQNIVAIRR